MDNHTGNQRLGGYKAANERKTGVFVKALAIWLVAAFAITTASVLSYTATQQSLRLSANWPQVQMARDGAAAIASGQPADSIVGADKINIAASLAPFVIVYDADGNPVASSGLLNGQTPKIPSGVLDYAAKNGEDRVSWTPDKNVRVAAVVEKVNGGPGGAVLAGRSLEETESIIDKIGYLLLALWAGSVAFLLVVCLLFALVMKKRQ